MTVPAFSRRPGEFIDVCLIVEGCYPHVSGGVSTWVDWLIRSCPDLRFGVRSLVPLGEDRRSRYPIPVNLVDFQEIVLAQSRDDDSSRPRRGSISCDSLAPILIEFLECGTLNALTQLDHAINNPQNPVPLRQLVSGPYSWSLCVATYEAIMPHASFKDFFWAWHALMGGLFSVMKTELPAAAAYHTISTGYAGLLAARATISGATNVILTEHGIYTNERRIEILMADWIVDTIDKGLGIADPRRDLRDLWIAVFESYARICYAACSHVTTLFADNQPMQRMLGAEETRLEIIPNGIDLDRFGAIPECPPDHPPTVALIGRIVPIKDIKTFLMAAAAIRDRVRNVRIVIAGSSDENPSYAEECFALAQELDLGSTVEFVGQVDVKDLLATTHVVVLTSLSEAQPLTVLEAGAAGRPCVTTDVGACREILEGPPGEEGGYIAELLAADQVADHVVRLLNDRELRQRCGDNLRRKVRRHYASADAAARYRALYGVPSAQSRKLG